MRSLLAVCIIIPLASCVEGHSEDVYGKFEAYLQERARAQEDRSGVEWTMLNRLALVGSFDKTPYIPLQWSWKPGRDGNNRLVVVYAGVDCAANSIEVIGKSGEKNIFEIPPEYIAENKKDEGAGVPYSIVVRTGEVRFDIGELKIYKQ